MISKATLLGFSILLLQSVTVLSQSTFKAGAAQSVITPPIGYSTNGNFQDIKATHIHDDTHAKAIVLESAGTQLAIVVADLCMIDRTTLDKAKEKASKYTGIPTQHMMMSATHTHSGGTACGVFQSDPEPFYLDFLSERIADAVIRAAHNLTPAVIGFGKIEEPSQLHNRRWFLKDKEQMANPFGGYDKVRMNPGIKNPSLIEPAGPIDPELSFVSIKSTSGQHLALLGNYSLHYVGGVGNGHVSADYFGMYGELLRKKLQSSHAEAPFIGIMTNGTSGDVNNIDWKSGSWTPVGPYKQMERVATLLAERTLQQLPNVTYQSHLQLGALQEEISLGVRKASTTELARAKAILAKHPEKELTNLEALYAREAVLLDKYPDHVKLILQVFRIGDFPIAALPCEVFTEIGLSIKKKAFFTVSLANGYNGYLPTPKHHELGGYETWRARSSYLEVNASEKILGKLLPMLDKLSISTTSVTN